MASPNSAAEFSFVEVTTFPPQSAEVQAKVARLQADTDEMVAERDRFAAINGPFIAAGGDPDNIPNPWRLTPARLDNMLRLYYGLKPHDRSFEGISFVQYFGSIDGIANGYPIGTRVTSFNIHTQVTNLNEIWRMVKCIQDSESFGEGGTGLPVHGEGEPTFNILVTMT
ncbi:uncharacterized protein J4E78_004404 [Alternaria triticimaculans]|uniref:uncharacterized protein n=1 Tax=Alternaria triticimaculans TaxID=297637 RepID=UPI0020C5469B|nr:uncharacterized protein J4E78_004404 [Alternaria triticimaculans]KAI4661615.1 hypothetical protein J4E78_004404 [Alternaria triticimaculans]